ncbi:serine/threonine-protein kinase [Victivallis sp. Marseille-Q1083]|uniref:serine/threonine-protein kinase n=1 Tax=Victivallis sp. Marseille-Q1083 TaxID=2717288 RepID=UPI00158C8833|nr:serine/threonine-protein kinase [Victivallis sp. Marseille-Q1083]
MQDDASKTQIMEPVQSTRTVTLEELAPPADSAALSVRDVLRDLPVKPRDRYKFLRTIGFGGMKSVLLVYDSDTLREVALAIMPDYRERKVQDILRFVQEAKITARLEHPNIVPVHDFGVDTGGAPYFTMKYLQGRTMATILRKLRQRDEETLAEYDISKLLRIYLRICNAIGFAHSQQIIHLDLKPENIHVGEFGEVQVLDWGLAKPIEAPELDSAAPACRSGKLSAGQTRDGVARGTPGYMAPEQAAGRNRQKDQRTDIYALGCILYAMLTFETPLAGQEVQEVLKATIRGNIKTPSELENPVRPIPAALEAICLKAMERYQENRYQSVDELREDITAFMGGFAPKAANANPLQKTFLFIGRNLLASCLAVAVFLLLLTAGVLVYCYVNEIITLNI